MYTKEDMEELLSKEDLIDYALHCQDRIRIFYGCVFSCTSKTGDCKKYQDAAREEIDSHDKIREKAIKKKNTEDK